MPYITEIGTYLPGEPVTNENIEDILGKVNDRPSRAKRMVLRSNGIKTRHYAIDPETRRPTHTNADLTIGAIRDIFKKSDTRLEDIELLACGTTAPDQQMPSHASMVHGQLGFPCEVISTAGVCCSSMAAVKYSYLSVLSGDKKKAIATGSEIASKFLRGEYFHPEKDEDIEKLTKNEAYQFEQDFIRWMLSDGAGSFLIEDRPKETGISLKIDWIESCSYANEYPVCMFSGIKRHGEYDYTSWLDYSKEEVEKWNLMSLAQDTKILDKNICVAMAEKPIPGIKKKRGLNVGDIDWFVPHYSSDYFRKKLHASMEKVDFGIPLEKWFTTLSSKGNIGSASIFVYLRDLMDQKDLKDGDKILCFIPESARFSVFYMHLTVCKK